MPASEKTSLAISSINILMSYVLEIHIVYFDINSGYYPGFHHGLAYLLSSIKQDGHDVRFHYITDEADLNKAAQTIDKRKPAIAGFSISTAQSRFLREFLSKLNTPETMLIAGGVHATCTREAFFEEFPDISAICIGEGETPLRELCARIKQGEDYLTVPSFFFKHNGAIIKNKIAPLQEVASLAPPAYDMFDYKKIVADSDNTFNMMLSRGCPFKCNYCINHVLSQIYPNKNRYVRFLDVSHAIELIKSNLSLCPDAKKISFSDDTFTINKKWLKDFCKAYGEEISLPFKCNARVENINDETMEALKEAGCTSIEFGVESGSQWLRKHVFNRRHSNEVIINAFKTVRKYGIKAFSYNIIGSPFETREMALETLDLNLRIQPDFGIAFYCYPFVGTELYSLCVKYGLIDKSISDNTGYIHAPSIKEVFMKHSDMIEINQKLTLFLNLQMPFSKLGLPSWLRIAIYHLLKYFRTPINAVIKPREQSGMAWAINKVLKKVARKYFK